MISDINVYRREDDGDSRFIVVLADSFQLRYVSLDIWIERLPPLDCIGTRGQVKISMEGANVMKKAITKWL
jgi:hypothetical protein